MFKLIEKIQRFIAIRKAMRELERYQILCKEKIAKGERIVWKADNTLS